LARYVRNLIESGDVALVEVEAPWPGAQPMFRPKRGVTCADVAECAGCDVDEADAIEVTLKNATPDCVRASDLGHALRQAGVRSSVPLAQLVRRLIAEGAPLEEWGSDRGQPCFAYCGGDD